MPVVSTEVYPGWCGTGWVPGRAIPGTHQALSQGPKYSIFRVLGPTHGQMKAILDPSMRFLRLGLEWVPERVPEWPQNDPSGPLPQMVPRWPSDHPYPDLRKPMVQIRVYLRFY